MPTRRANRRLRLVGPWPRPRRAWSPPQFRSAPGGAPPRQTQPSAWPPLRLRSVGPRPRRRQPVAGSPRPPPAEPPRPRQPPAEPLPRIRPAEPARALARRRRQPVARVPLPPRGGPPRQPSPPAAPPPRQSAVAPALQPRSTAALGPLPLLVVPRKPPRRDGPLALRLRVAPPRAGATAARAPRWPPGEPRPPPHPYSYGPAACGLQSETRPADVLLAAKLSSGTKLLGACHKENPR